MSSKWRPIARFALAALLLLGALGALAAWHAANILPSGHDAHMHFMVTITLARVIAHHFAGLGRLLLDQPARYMPLTYALGAISLLLTNQSSWSLSIVTLILMAVAMVGLLAIGRKFAPGRWLLLLPLAVMLANPVFWEVGFSYNLEASAVAGAVVILALLLFAGELRPPPLFVAGLLVAASLTLSKTILLLSVLPAGFVFVWTGDRATKARRGVLLVAIGAAAAWWLVPRAGALWTEFVFHRSNPQPVNPSGPGFYLRVLLLDYRGLPLVAALVALLAARWRAKDLVREDLALALFVLTPLVFHMIMADKNPWFILAGYVAAPVWCLFSAQRSWERRWVRILSYAVIGVYLALVLVNIAVTLAVTRPPFTPGAVLGIRRPAPPGENDAAAARAMVRRGLRAIVSGDDTKATPLLALLLDANPKDFDARLRMAADLARAGHAAEAAHHWPAFFTPEIAFPCQMEALNALATLEAENLVPAGTFERYFAPPLAASANQPERRYQLLYLKMDFARQRADWPGALAAVRELRQTIRPEQAAVTNLDEARILVKLDQTSEAEKLLRENVKTTPANDPLFAESAGELARLLARRGAFAEAADLLRRAVSGAFEPSNLANALVAVAEQMRTGDKLEPAVALLNESLARLVGPAAGLVQIELARLFLAQRDEPRARRALEQAARLVTDPGLRQWIEETRRVVDRHEYRPW